MISGQVPQNQTKNQAKVETSDKDENLEIKRKGKKLVKKAPAEHSRESTPSLVRRALFKAAHNVIRSEAWVQKQKDKVTGGLSWRY